jgi:hypothetical protein
VGATVGGNDGLEQNPERNKMNTLAVLFATVAAIISMLNYRSKGKMNLMAGGSVVAAAITAILAIILKIQGA